MKTVARPGLLVALFCAGCVTMGPGTIGRDRISYDHAVSESWKQQLLLNLVKLRYGDAPLFLDVTSIINSYSLDAEVKLQANWANLSGAGSSDSQMLGGTGRYADKPTITYNPITGARFTRSLMTPVPPGVVVSLVQAGWPADRVFRLMVTSVNGIQNRFGAGGRARGADPEFGRLTATLRRIQASGAVGMRLDRTDEKEWAVMTLARPDVAKEVAEDLRIVRDILGLRYDRKDYRVVFGSARRSEQEVAMLTRSMLEMLFDLSSVIEVPPADVEEGRVLPTAVFETDAPAGFQPLIRVHSGARRHADAFVAVEYRDNWFWVDDRDYASKGVFSFLLILLSLTDADPGRGAPIVTIPTG